MTMPRDYLARAYFAAAARLRERLPDNGLLSAHVALLSLRSIAECDDPALSERARRVLADVADKYPPNLAGAPK